MVVVYSALPLLRNVPGNMILSKVCGDKYNYKSSKLKKKKNDSTHNLRRLLKMPLYRKYSMMF